MLTLAALALPGCQAMVNVDDYTFHGTPLADDGAGGSADAGAAVAGGAGGALGSSGSSGASGNGGAGGNAAAPPAQAGAGGTPADPGPSVDPVPPPEVAMPGEVAPEEVPLAPGVAALEALPRASAGFLRPAEVLVIGTPLRSRNGYIELRLERDGLIVTHQQVDTSLAVVASFPLTNAHIATLAENGHFVVLARDGSVTDISSAAGPVTGPTLRVQNDGNVVLYDNDAVLPRAAHWASNTNFRRFADACRRLEPNQVIYPAGSPPLPSCNGLFSLVMDAEGRLSVIDSQNVIISQSPLGGGPEAITIMQRDGNLVTYDVNDAPQWATNTSNVPGAYAALEDDGTLALYDSNDVQIW